MGRTGKMFACEHYDVQADIICIAKGIGSGLPIGACVARADFMDWKPGAHASTFGGNPVCIAAALKTIELLEGGLVKNAAEVGAYLKAGLEKLQQKHDCIVDVRGYGMMLGVEFETAELRDRDRVGVLRARVDHSRRGRNTIRWSPPLILTKENVDVALEIFDDADNVSPCNLWLISNRRARKRSSSTLLTRPSRYTSRPATTVKITSRPDEAKINVAIGS